MESIKVLNQKEEESKQKVNVKPQLDSNKNINESLVQP